MVAQSAGLLVYRCASGGPEFLLVHPGGPFWRGKDVGAWSIPKGVVEPGETPFAAALREFAEEVGAAPAGYFRPLAPIRQKAGKIVHAWMIEADVDLTRLPPDMVELEHPRGSGRILRFPEVDEAAYFLTDLALAKILPAQRALIEQALALL